MSDDQTVSVDEALAEITIIINRLDSMGPGDLERADLIARRDELRKSARDASAASRSDDALRYERHQAQRRLAEVETRFAERSKAEKRTFKWINDPGSYENRINQMLRDQDEQERHDLNHRIAQIEAQLGDTGPGPEGSS